MDDMSKTRRHYNPEFKAQIVLDILREEHTVNELAAKYQISPVVISRWKAEFLEKAAEVFRKGPSDADKELAEKSEHIAELERKVGQLTIETDFLKKKSREFAWWKVIVWRLWSESTKT